MTSVHAPAGLNGLPIWVKALATISTTTAIILVTFYLLYAVIEQGAAQQHEIQALSRSNSEVMTAMSVVLREHAMQNQHQLDQIRGVLQSICVNAARTVDERQGCVARVP